MTKAKDPNITPAELIARLNYDPHTGVFTSKTGKRIGYIKAGSGYRVIDLCGKRMREHRLAWFYCTGRWPEGQIDHINRKRDDNRICNLREATPALQSYNSSRSAPSPYGRNIQKSRNGYKVRFQNAGKTISLGTYVELKDATLVATVAQALLGQGAIPVRPVYPETTRQKLQRAGRERYLQAVGRGEPWALRAEASRKPEKAPQPRQN